MGRGAIIEVNLSGRGDKDVETAAKWFGLFARPTTTRKSDRVIEVEQSEAGGLGPVLIRATPTIARR